MSPEPSAGCLEEVLVQLGAAGCRALTKQTEPVRRAPEAPGPPAVLPCGQISFVPSTA